MPKYRWNRYSDLEIDLVHFDLSGERSLSDLVSLEIKNWEKSIRGRRGEMSAVLWVRVPEKYVKFVACLLDNGFRMHHANASYIMLVRKRSSRSCVPIYGSHYARVECLVVERGSGRILMVRETTGPSDCLKLVTGSVDLNEFLSKAAVREVREETGVRCDFCAMLGVGNRLATRFGRDEMLFGMLLLAEPGQSPAGNGAETSEATWVTPQEAASRGSATAREWMLASGMSLVLSRGTMDDFRGPPHCMEVFMPKERVFLPQQSV